MKMKQNTVYGYLLHLCVECILKIAYNCDNDFEFSALLEVSVFLTPSFPLLSLLHLCVECILKIAYNCDNDFEFSALLEVSVFLTPSFPLLFRFD